MKKIDALEAVASYFDIPVGKLIDMVQAYSGEEPTSASIEIDEILSKRIVDSEKVGLNTEYINGLKDARKLVRNTL